MSHNTLYLPGFSHHLTGGRTKSATAKLTKQADNLDGLAALVAKFIPAEIFTPGAGQRKRVFTPWITFVAFLGQALTRGSSCRESVRRVQAWCAASRQAVPDDSSSGYCQARERLTRESLEQAHGELGGWLDRRRGESWCGRSVKVLDGCGVSMPDTAENREQWSYPGGQKPGCGFPTGKLVGLFCLTTGRLVRFAFASLRFHEITLARQLLPWINRDEVVLADRGFCGWGFMALLQQQGVDVVLRLQGREHAKTLGQSEWKKPKLSSARWTKELWAELPDKLTVRVVRFRVSVPGFRTHEVVLVTTLLDATAYPDAAIIDLYRKRWAVELFFREIKTTLGLDVLRCRSPELIEKEIWLQAIAYNLVRALMLEAALTYQLPVERLSFKGTVDTLRQWTPLFAPAIFASRAARRELLRIIAADQVPDRPGRSEPRARKRRPHNYWLLTQPRHQMIVPSHRGQLRKPSLT
jgi:hypothetical protein